MAKSISEYIQEVEKNVGDMEELRKLEQYLNKNKDAYDKVEYNYMREEVENAIGILKDKIKVRKLVKSD